MEWMPIEEKEKKDATNRELFCEMARIGLFFMDKFEVYVRTNDLGNEPHFHVRDASTQGEEFHTCVKIKEAMYFHHDGKEDVLGTHERKALDDYLRAAPTKKYKRISFPTNWDKVVYEWNENNSTMQVDEDLAQPDYTTIVDNKCAKNIREKSL